jgi:hypothetical protein
MNKKQTAAVAKYNKALEAYRLGSVSRKAKMLELIQVCVEEESAEIEALTDADGDVQQTFFGNVEESQLVPVTYYEDLPDALGDELPTGDVTEQTDELKRMIEEVEG